MNLEPASSNRRRQWIEKLTQRLDSLTESLKEHPGALALLGVGSTGNDSLRMDEYSDLDFFVIVKQEIQQSFLQDIGWLRAAAPIVYDFENSKHGRKVLFIDGVFAEYAVLTEDELSSIAQPTIRVVWSRDHTKDWSVVRTNPVPAAGMHEGAEFHLNEAVTNLSLV
ncbi:MAG: hypothetical protein ACRCTR_10190 [Actinomycetota bacterium]